MTPETFFAALWQDYIHHAPSAERIHALLGRGQPIVNDHIALRTFRTPTLGLDALEPLILDMGFAVGEDYRFVAKKLRARHYLHPDPTVPKIFLSELLLEECSPALQATIAGLLEQMPAGSVQGPEFLGSGRHWEVAHADYVRLLEESEYAAWLAALGFRANHFTVSVNQLPGFASVDAVNAVLLEAGFAMNRSGGLVKGGPEVRLAQSATLADRITVSFSDGQHEIPGCFYEFAWRYPMPDGQLYQGFVEASADKIFESTNVRT